MIIFIAVTEHYKVQSQVRKGAQVDSPKLRLDQSVFAILKKLSNYRLNH